MNKGYWYHCPKKEDHPHGFDLCHDCAKESHKRARIYTLMDEGYTDVEGLGKLYDLTNGNIEAMRRGSIRTLKRVNENWLKLINKLKEKEIRTEKIA